ncbi:hypothetical protein Aab01nite_51000 [Paractinoplanes abujensis]|nr:hypothetical protein Aab01nite_51000 [Actinoplanes abujensis]
MTPRRSCPECGQDWVRLLRFKDDGSRFFVCPECDSLWWSERSVGVERPFDLDEVLAGRLNVVGNPWVDRVWDDVMEPVPASGSTHGGAAGPSSHP